MDEIIDILEGLQRNHQLDCRRRTQRIGMLQSIWRGWGGRVQSSVRVLPAPLPQIENRPLAEVPSLVHNNGLIMNEDAGIEPEYDVFISHASEDKDEVVRPLANALKNLGIKVWYDEFEMRIGDSLRRKIDKGLANSRFGIVVVSRDFIKRAGQIMSWTAL